MATARSSSIERDRIALFHPDLGIGGAERLVVDAALALQQRGYDVVIYTAFHDPKRAFKETVDGTVPVSVYGNWIPRHVFGKMYALFAYLRMIYLAFAVLLFHRFSVIICDQVSACIPVIRAMSRAKVLFYCHFPDMLLTKRDTTAKSLYRAPLDWLEEKTTGMADVIFVNSKFTAGVFKRTFKSLADRDPTVLYPSLNFSAFDKSVPELDTSIVPTSARPVFLSINRYEAKKNVRLAVEAFVSVMATLDRRRQTRSVGRSRPHLVIAGGYDPRLPENVGVYNELLSLVKEHDVQDSISFLRSFSDDEKLQLLNRCTCLVYTPENEHFGITPLEAMYMHKPVIAVRSGGPLETVVAGKSCSAGDDVEGQTGFLCEPIAKDFAQAMLRFVDEDSLSESFGLNGRRRVARHFSFDAFATKLSLSIEHSAL